MTDSYRNSDRYIDNEPWRNPAEATNGSSQPRIYLQDADFTLYNGDALEVLRELPAESVQMCVTSPPFFGLRDYGTGTWEGGDAECDHAAGRKNTGHDGNVGPRNADGNAFRNSGRYVEQGDAPKDTCKCGARRVDRQIGLEQTPEEWVASLVAVFEEVRRVLRKDGTLWVECGDSYATGGPRSTGRNDTDRETPGGRGGSFRGGERREIEAFTPGLKPKDLIGQPFLLAFALRDAGWYWRNVCIWHKPNPMPESVRDRFTVSHSYVLLFSKSLRYFFDAEAVREELGPTTLRSNGLGDDGRGYPSNSKVTPKDRNAGGEIGWGNQAPGARRSMNPAGRNARSVWTIATEPLPFEHYAAFPQALAERCIKAGTSERGCCPECGAGWVRETAVEYVADGSGTTGYRRDIKEPYGRQNGTGDAGKPKMARVASTLDWHPSCDCTLPLRPGQMTRAPAFTPCTVLDPFLGSGTTALVARRLNRRCIGIELSSRYCELAAKRTQQLSLTAAAVE